MKIYNEIVIDMNPESSTFEETLFEDSFEYSNSDVMQMQGDTSFSSVYILSSSGNGYLRYEYRDGQWVSTGQWSSINVFTETEREDGITTEGIAIYDSLEQVTEGGQDFGLPSMTEEMWTGMSETEKAKYILKTKYQGDVPGEEFDLEYLIGLLRQQPLKGEIDPTKAGFLSEQYGGAGPDGVMGTEDDVSFAESIAGRKAGQALSTSLTGFQGEAGKIAGAMQNVYGGTGTGMRAGVAGQKVLKTGVETAYKGYGLEEDVADLDYRKGMYGLEEDVTGQWEADWQTFWSGLPVATGSV